jgi:hypothetical protein
VLQQLRQQRPFQQPQQRQSRLLSAVVRRRPLQRRKCREAQAARAAAATPSGGAQLAKVPGAAENPVALHAVALLEASQRRRGGWLCLRR